MRVDIIKQTVLYWVTTRKSSTIDTALIAGISWQSFDGPSDTPVTGGCILTKCVHNLFAIHMSPIEIN